MISEIINKTKANTSFQSGKAYVSLDGSAVVLYLYAHSPNTGRFSGIRLYDKANSAMVGYQANDFIKEQFTEFKGEVKLVFE